MNEEKREIKLDFEDKKPEEPKGEIEQLKTIEPTVPKIDFANTMPPAQTNEPAGQVLSRATENSVIRAGELVDEAFSQAVVAQVQNNEKIQEQLIDSAEKVIKNKVDAVKSVSELEDKKAHFNNKKGACECFGYNETTTEKWAVNAMNFWHNIMTGIWILIGCVTFAPITFVAKKIRVIIKASWAAILLAIVIYAAVATAPWWGGLIAKLSS